MIPVKLDLRNFMCYRGSENAVDFSGIHLACLAGDNGQGKSALLDAITWALWGKSRARRDDDLITYGETEMEVQLEFDLSGERYRVVRQRSSAGRGSSTLELQGRTESGFFASLSEPTIRESQKRITDLLRLDYDTFVNSVFLLQGRADEFTTKRPAERKQILADILGLAEYDVYAERARRQARSAEERRVQAERELEQIRQQIEQIPIIEEELLNAEAAALQLDEQVRAEVEVLQGLIAQRRTLDAKADALTQAELRARDARAEIARVQTRLQQLQEKMDHYNALLERAEEIEGAVARLEQARTDKERWDSLLQESLQLQNEVKEYQNRIAQARAVLESDLRVAESKARTCKSTLERFKTREQELGEAQRQVELLERLQHECSDKQRLLLEWTGVRGQLGAENERLRDEMHDLKQRMELLQGTEEAECPVCRRPLSEEARVHALEGAQHEGTSMGDRYRENQGALKRATRMIGELERAITSIERQLAELGRWQRRAADAASAAEEMRRARQELESAERQVAEIRARLEAGDYAHEEQTRLAELASASASVQYDKAQHEAAKQVIQQLVPRQQEFQELAMAREQHVYIQDSLQAHTENLCNCQTRLAAAEEEIATLNKELQEREALRRRVQEQQVFVNNLQSDKTRADRRLGAAKQRLEYAEQYAARKPEVEAAYHAAVEERTIYEQLTLAFGKQGVQAMIIESAIPDIEGAANTLLSRMTDGRMSVSLQTQREGRTVAAIETLDIVIADENGERPYETFSGGEAFRVNFALRVALSKLLAHRSGANLRTLVIDEGFGSQDAQGRERLIEAITSVQEDFERIIVITHIDELKDAFPIRIDVVKGPNGSRVMVQ